MQEFTNEQIAANTTAYLMARRHMTNAIEELRKMSDAVGIVSGRETHCFSPFGDRGGELLLSRLSERDMANYQQNLERGCWRLLVWKSGVMDTATGDDRRKIEQEIHSGKFGAFNEENIGKVMAQLKNQEGELVKNVAKEAFRHFSPNPVRKEPIKQRTVHSCGTWGSLSFSSCHSPAWEILQKTLYLLDHKEPPEQYGDTIIGQMTEAVQKGGLEYECPYFRAKFYKKSLTAHLTFTRMDLINIINEIGRTA